jgi:uncharacterized protein YndB with AHSA1/START domain
MNRIVRPLRLGAGAAGALGLLYAASVLRRRAAWQATDAEAARPLPGDDLVAAPLGSMTHAITIRRAPRDVWPWLVQMGADRAGWYSYDVVDNGRRQSLKRIAPELQHVAAGSVMPAAPGVSDGFTVLRVEPERALVLGWVPPSDGAPVSTWAFVLEEPEPGHTRLLVRSRSTVAPFGLPDWTMRSLVPWGHAIMQRKQLLGIRERAEGRETP